MTVVTSGPATPLRIFVRPERRFVAEGRPTELVVLVRLVPAPVPPGEELPLNLSVLVDCSESMATGRLDAAKDALIALVHRLGPDDRLAVVTAGDFVDAAVPSTRVADPEAIKRAIRQIRPGGMAAWIRVPSGLLSVFVLPPLAPPLPGVLPGWAPASFSGNPGGPPPPSV